MTVFRGVLFDFDGTLADTMEGHYLAWKAALEQHGINVEASEYYPLEGTGLHEVARALCAGRSWTDAEIDELVRQKKGRYVSSQRPIVLYPGVEALIGELQSNAVPLAIVTAGHLDQLTSTVPAEFLDRFDTVVTGDQLSRGKPDPEPYLKAAASLGLKAGECIAVENAPVGVLSAKRAGAYCIGVCSTVDERSLAGADEVWPSFADLKRSEVIRSLLRATTDA